ncbi:hypothetical protein E2C06_12500 [Dankookia rubra]|uniref:Uncharacterized protein n=1 Tax=Dankookia rubra TaxID=1442381 RepID=A0A4V3AA94_9PROT|nr:hypothetical protein [Dankookia rubra]TDH62205.1 hypothetical protein E2C06_12500 [Dankookia rubra]
MPNANAPKDTGKGTGESGWTEQEKGQDASGQPATATDAGEAGDAKPKGRPSDDREKTETAASDTARDAKR